MPRAGLHDLNASADRQKHTEDGAVRSESSGTRKRSAESSVSKRVVTHSGLEAVVAYGRRTET